MVFRTVYDLKRQSLSECLQCGLIALWGLSPGLSVERGAVQSSYRLYTLDYALKELSRLSDWRLGGSLVR